LKRLHQRLRTTTVYVTHDQEEAMTLGDRIVAMKDGRVQQADTPLNMYNKPVNRFVAGFIGMPPMNFFDGALRVVDGQMIFEEGSLGRVGLGYKGANGEGGSRDVNSPAELTLPGNGFRLTIPARLRDALAGRVGQHVVLGVRPEHLHLRPTDQEGASSPLTLKVSVVEPLGNDMDVYAETAVGHRVVARVEAAEEYGSTSGDSEVKMFVDLRKIHVFEPGETGMSLSLTTPREPAHAIA
jgi:multiple sugar transport system ATP-binding protein